MFSSSDKQWSTIDASELCALPQLGPDDHCYYFLDRTNGTYQASYANDRIDNFKKDLKRWHDRPDVLKYKWRAIDEFARDLADLFGGELRGIVGQFDLALVPMPTSIAPTEPFYDDRLVRLCERTATIVGNIRVADVLHARAGTQSAHKGGTRDVRTIAANLVFDGFGRNIPEVVVLVDDVLTTGSHYVACRDAINSAYPGILVLGAFLSIHRSRFVDYEALGISFDI